MKKILSLLLLSMLCSQSFAQAAKIEGKLVSLDPIAKSIRIKRINQKGVEEKIDIGVPDGTMYSGRVPSVVDLKPNDKVSITVKIGAQPGTWVASEIKQIVDASKVELKSSAAAAVPPKPKEIVKATTLTNNDVKKIVSEKYPSEVQNEGARTQNPKI